MPRKIIIRRKKKKTAVPAGDGDVHKESSPVESKKQVTKDSEVVKIVKDKVATEIKTMGGEVCLEKSEKVERKGCEEDGRDKDGVDCEEDGVDCDKDGEGRVKSRKERIAKPLSIREKNEMWQEFQSEIDSLFNDTSDSKSPEITTDIQSKLKKEAYKGEGMTEVCLECLQDTLVEGASGCYECTSCGVIGNQIIDTGAEWRFYGSEDNKSSDPTRCGMPSNELLPQSSLGSVVGYGWKGDTFEMHRIRKYQGWNAMPYKERARYNDFQIIQQTAARGGLPQCIIEDAKSQYKKITEDQISRGANRKGLRAACVYSACKKYNVPRSDKEVAEIFEIKDITIMTRACKLFQQIWNTHQKSTMKDIMMPASRPGDFIQRFCSKLGMSQNSLDLANRIASRAEEYGMVSENTPPSIAAGSIYLVVQLEKLPITKREIATACKISEVTICKCFKKLHKYQKHLLD